MFEVWLFRLFFVVFTGSFLWQVSTRVRLIARAKRNFKLDDLPQRLRRWLAEVVFQTKVIAEKPVVGLAHAFVFWGFVAFSGYTTAELLKGLGLVDLTGTPAFHTYVHALLPFALLVLAGIVCLVIRRIVFKPEALGPLSGESILIGCLITALMVTFLLDLRIEGESAERFNWWAHALIVLCFLVVIPGSKHLHLLLAPVTVFLKAPSLGTVPNLDFEKEEVGFETVADLPGKQVLDAFTCVECGRCQMNCPAYMTGKLLNPKKLILDGERVLLAGRLQSKLVDVYGPTVLWQCTTCGACENQCPVGIEHLPLVIGARRGLVSNGETPGFLGAVYNNLERRGNIWGLTYDQREKFVESAGLETFDRERHEYLIWLGCAGSFETDYQRSLRSLVEILKSRQVTFGVLARERCTGDMAKRTGNEHLFQELARRNVEDFRKAGVEKIITSCPHCVKTLGDDYRAFGFGGDVTHSAVLVAELTRDVRLGGTEQVAYHDPCYLARYGRRDGEPRALLDRVGAVVLEPVRNRRNPFCCGAGGGLMFEENEQGKRVSHERLEQLEATGAKTIVTACPFCSIMLKGAQASTNASTECVDLMTFVNGKLNADRVSL